EPTGLTMTLPMKGIRPASESSIEIEFLFEGTRRVERLRMKPTPANLQRAARQRADIMASIERGDFDYEATFGPRRMPPSNT
ncbi:MAG: DUF3596 domain-containing protein, partial [Burkholderiaceae bacterium]